MGRIRHARDHEFDPFAGADLRQRGDRAGALLRGRHAAGRELRGPEGEVPGAGRGYDAAAVRGPHPGSGGQGLVMLKALRVRPNRPLPNCRERVTEGLAALATARLSFETWP